MIEKSKKILKELDKQMYQFLEPYINDAISINVEKLSDMKKDYSSDIAEDKYLSLIQNTHVSKNRKVKILSNNNKLYFRIFYNKKNKASIFIETREISIIYKGEKLTVTTNRNICLGNLLLFFVDFSKEVELSR